MTVPPLRTVIYPLVLRNSNLWTFEIVRSPNGFIQRERAPLHNKVSSLPLREEKRQGERNPGKCWRQASRCHTMLFSRTLA